MKDAPEPVQVSGLLGMLPYTESQKEVVMKWTITVAGLILVCAASASAQRLEVKIIDREDKEDSYDYAASSTMLQ
jgi:hypothetical protein